VIENVGFELDANGAEGVEGVREQQEFRLGIRETPRRCSSSAVST
jgi:hypothetical protein